MGIRFYCPNGHKLNVKEFQAGLRGVCPHCGAKMQIPLESARASSQQEKSLSPGSAPVAGAKVPAPSWLADTPDEPLEIDAVPPAEGQAASPSPRSSAAATFDQSPVAGTADPLEAAGNVVWYVRPPSGGQFGPAGARAMRSWLVEGRVSVDTLVWREGWREWRRAGDVFLQLSDGQTFPGLEAIEPEPIAVPTAAHHAVQHVPPRKMQLIALGVLGGAILVLVLSYFLITVFRS